MHSPVLEKDHLALQILGFYVLPVDLISSVQAREKLSTRQDHAGKQRHPGKNQPMTSRPLHGKTLHKKATSP
jgi:hypothetical protein